MAVPLQALIVEDSADDAELLLRELERGGFDVRFRRVETAEDFNQALEEEEWDVVFADYTMPVFRGTTALRMVRERGSDIPFLFVSATIGEDVAVEAMKSGANDYVTKGSLKRLVPAVQRELRDSAERRERRRIEEEHRAAEEALRAVEERHRALFAHIADIVLLYDRDGRIRFASTSSAEVLGYEPAELVGRSYFDFVHPGDRARAREAAGELLRVPDASGTIVVRMGHRDGSWRTVDAATRNLLDHPDVGGVVVTARDVTEQKLLEAEVAQAQRLESIGRLAGGVAHDFNNLLTVILGNAELLLASQEGEAERLDLEEIQAAAVRARDLTRQLLAFGRRQALEPRVLDLNAVVSGVERMLRRILGEDVELDTRLASDLGTVRADPGQLEQVLMNLAVNARDAMPQGGHLTIATANTDLDEHYSTTHASLSPGSYVLLSVTDTGTGMDAETLAHIFEPFFTTKPAGEGTGLGLSTVYGIVNQSGGQVRAHSEPGRGTTFEVYLPRADDAPEPCLARETAPEPEGRGELVLVVEDDGALRRLACRMLRSFGFEVVEAAGTAEALEWLRSPDNEPDLVLTDVVLPDEGGVVLAQEAARLHPGLRVLFMSGYAGTTLERHGFRGSGIPLVEKPFTGEKLARMVRRTLDRDP